eukprot:COSAG01_NODE_6687_length_3542_cov_3.271856_4_plen_76_part_00
MFGTYEYLALVLVLVGEKVVLASRSSEIASYRGRSSSSTVLDLGDPTTMHQPYYRTRRTMIDLLVATVPDLASSM